jgi:hypothetical protein
MINSRINSYSVFLYKRRFWIKNHSIQGFFKKVLEWDFGKNLFLFSKTSLNSKLQNYNLYSSHSLKLSVMFGKMFVQKTPFSTTNNPIENLLIKIILYQHLYGHLLYFKIYFKCQIKWLFIYLQMSFSLLPPTITTLWYLNRTSAYYSFLMSFTINKQLFKYYCMS